MGGAGFPFDEEPGTVDLTNGGINAGVSIQTNVEYPQTQLYSLSTRLLRIRNFVSTDSEKMSLNDIASAINAHRTAIPPDLPTQLELEQWEHSLNYQTDVSDTIGGQLRVLYINAQTTIVDVEIPLLPPFVPEVDPSPSDGSTDVAIDVVTRITFSGPMNTSTVEAALSVKEDGSPYTLDALLTWGVPEEGRTNEELIITLHTLFRNGKVYEFTIADSATNIDGVPLASPFVFSFTTVA